MDPNLRARRAEINHGNTANSYIANGWWPLVFTSNASGLVHDLSLDQHRGPSMGPDAGVSSPDVYWAHSWVFGLAYMIAPNHAAHNIFDHSYNLVDLDAIEQFVHAYRQHIDNPQEQLVTLTEFLFIAKSEAGGNSLRYQASAINSANVDLNRTRITIRAHKKDSPKSR